MKLEKLKIWLNSLFRNSLAQNTLWMLLAQGMRLVLQAIYFVIIARSLGAEQYGAFVGVTAFVAILSPFVSLGAGFLLLKNVSINRALFSEYWGNSLLLNFASGLLFIAFLLLVSPLFLPKTISLLLVFLIAVNDLIFARILDTACQAFKAIMWFSKTTQLIILQQITRLMAALSLVSFFPNPSLIEWSFLYLISTAISTWVGVVLVHRSIGLPKVALSRIKPEITEGFYYSISASAQTIYNDIDKIMLARLSSLEATGIYATAYRLIDIAFVPVQSLLAATSARFFQRGTAGISGTINFSKRLLPIAGIYSASTGIGLLLFAPVIPYVLGNEYADAVEAIRWLAPLLFLKAMHYLAGDAVTGAGFQGGRSAVQVTVAVFNVLVNLWLIPLYSWRGATWSSLAADGLLLLSLWVMVIFLYQQQAQMLKENKQ